MGARQGACSAMPPLPHAQRTALHGGPASSLSCGKHQQVIEGQAAETAATSIGLSSTKRHAYAAEPRSWQPTLAAGGSPLVLSMPARTWQYIPASERAESAPVVGVSTSAVALGPQRFGAPSV